MLCFMFYNVTKVLWNELYLNVMWVETVAQGHWGHHLGAIKEGLHSKANVAMFIQM